MTHKICRADVRHLVRAHNLDWCVVISGTGDTEIEFVAQGCLAGSPWTAYANSLAERIQGFLGGQEAASREQVYRDMERHRCRAHELEDAIARHHGQKADDRCVEDDEELYASAGLPRADRRVGDKKAMLANCARFIDNRCQGGGWPSYVELEAKIAELEATVHALKHQHKVDQGAIQDRQTLADKLRAVTDTLQAMNDLQKKTVAERDSLIQQMEIQEQMIGVYRKANRELLKRVPPMEDDDDDEPQDSPGPTGQEQANDVG